MTGGWDVLDTAVKIGLGAAITGVVTLWVNGRQLRSQSAQELRQRRRQEWARSMELLVAFRKSLFRFNEEAGDYFVNRDEAQLENQMERKLEQAKAGLEAALLDLLEAHTRLGILAPPLAEALEAYRHACDEYFRDVWNAKDQFDDEDLAERWGRLEEPQARLFDELRRVEPTLNP